MICSMTGFASDTGCLNGVVWRAEIRSVNGRGLDIKCRIPEWIERFEEILRSELQTSATRGHISVSLKLEARVSPADQAVLGEESLAAILDALERIEQKAMDIGLSLAPSRAADILPLRGVLVSSEAGQQPLSEQGADLLEALRPMLRAFAASRAAEGAALKTIILQQLADFERLLAQAKTLLPQREAAAAKSLRKNLDKIFRTENEMDPQRVAQELALIAIKSDITEELDRLDAHVASARKLIEQKGANGRKLDFLMQEFNRETNTLCAKANYKELTDLGLELKVLTDQMREQIQNVE